MSGSTSKEWKAFLRWAKQRGWDVGRINSSHRMLRKGSLTYLISMGSGDPRALRNAYSGVRREERKQA